MSTASSACASSTSASLGLGDWSFEPTVVAGLVGLVVVYAWLWRCGRLRHDDDTAPWGTSPRGRPAWFGLGVLCCLLALQSPIDTGGDRYLLTIHMVQHLLLMMVAPPLILLGLVGLRPLPAGTAPRVRQAWTRISRPWPAAALFTAVLLVWHLPALYNTTLTNDGLHIVEHLTFIAVGVVFWWPVVDPVRGPDTVPVAPMTKIAMLVVAGIPPTALGFIFVMGRSAFYSFYASAPRLWGLSPVSDQQFAGVVMLGAGNLIYFLAITVIFLRMFGSPEDDEAAVSAATSLSGR